MSVAELLSFALASFLLALTPGPDVLLVLATAAARGWHRGLALTLGLASGVIVHTALVAFGLAAILARETRAMQGLKFFGAIYLLWLAWQSWRHRNDHLNDHLNETDAEVTLPVRDDSPVRWYARGVVMNLSNPKVLLFFLAFLPEFAHPGTPGFAYRVMGLGLIFMLLTVLVFGAVAFLAAAGAARFVKNPRFQSRMNAVATAVFVLIAGWLLFFA